MTPEQLKKSREKLELTQRQIAEELELSERFWLYRESGVRSISRWLARAVRDLVNNPTRRP